MNDKEKIKKAYDELAELYIYQRKNGGSSEFYNQMLEMPTTLNLLGNIKGKKILDLGCGPGVYAKILTEKGAKVTGIDNSNGSLIIAEKEAPKARFIFGDIEKLPFKNKQFDIVLSALVLGHLSNWNKVFKEVERVLNNKGIFIFSTHNPIREITKSKKWFFKKFRVAKSYFDERRVYDKWGKGKKEFIISHHHKTYGTIIRTIIKSGFEIIDYEDCKPLSKSKEKYPKEYELTTSMPNFSVWKVKKK